ncbi:MAG: acetate/propionate family kinase [Jatrophihabitantaceae bacterium]
MAESDGRVLVLNCGSSSVRLALLDPRTGHRQLTGLAERVGEAGTTVRVCRDGAEHRAAAADGSYHGVLAQLLSALTDSERADIAGVGHRVVHGGQRFTASVRVDTSVLTELRGLTDLAPLHLRANIAGIEAAQQALPASSQVAVFDTAFHQSMPPVAYRYAVPDAWWQQGVRRYGFHGTSHRYVSQAAADLLGRPLAELRMVTLHLGNGCSATAIRDGRSVDTSMGLTPLAGLVMGTRSGDLDPGVLGYVADRLGLDLAGMLDALNTRSGLLGLSGLSNDMRTLCEAAGTGSAAAGLAIDVFCYRVAKTVGALAVALGGLDVLVFTGGIGEAAVEIREAVLARLALLGLRLDRAANVEHGRASAGRISEPGEAVAMVVPTDEELLIARDTAQLS